MDCMKVAMEFHQATPVIEQSIMKDGDYRKLIQSDNEPNIASLT